MAAVCGPGRLGDFPYECCKNIAHGCGVEASIGDRLQSIKEAGLTADEALLSQKTFVVNWDNDAVVCVRWLHEVLRQSAEIINKLEGVNPVVGVQWQNSHLGTCGKIGLPWSIFQSGWLRRVDARHGLPGCVSGPPPCFPWRSSAHFQQLSWLHSVQPSIGIRTIDEAGAKKQEEGGL